MGCGNKQPTTTSGSGRIGRRRRLGFGAESDQVPWMTVEEEQEGGYRGHKGGSGETPAPF